MERMCFSGTAKGPHLSFKQMFGISVMVKNDMNCLDVHIVNIVFFKLAFTVGTI
jgi:hypothetical protein